jgi:hypothetical protein
MMSTQEKFIKYMKFLKYLYYFLFNRWEQQIYKTGSESWHHTNNCGVKVGNSFSRDFVIYKLTHKFSKQAKLKKVYFN